MYVKTKAPYLKIALRKALLTKGLKNAWDEILNDFQASKAVKFRLNRSSCFLRTDFRDVAYKVSQAVRAKRRVRSWHSPEMQVPIFLFHPFCMVM